MNKKDQLECVEEMKEPETNVDFGQGIDTHQPNQHAEKTGVSNLTTGKLKQPSSTKNPCQDEDIHHLSQATQTSLKRLVCPI